MARPSPVPGDEVLPRQNRWVARAFSSSERPAPSSMTVRSWARGGRCDACGDRGVRGGCRQGVVEQVVEDLFDRTGRGLDEPAVVRHIGNQQLDVVRVGDGGPRIDAITR